jgi:glutamate formiminotransferase/formiminotetrahydrofolate cyclodeaminase
MQTVVECVPNFSEGRDPAVVEAIIGALMAGPDVYLLGREMDADHNRSVVTFVGTRESVGQAALRGIAEAAKLIDLNHQQGVHPRLGATDVVPFVPLKGVTLADCVHIARWVAEETWRRFKIPTYLYEAAALRPERTKLESIRLGQFEKVREEVRTDPSRHPDFGEAEFHPTAGATVVGARRFLIAYNINLNTPDVAVAKAIARKIRASSGGYPSVKAMGVELKSRNLTQVSMNITDFETTSMGTVFTAVAREAAVKGVQIAGSQIVGLVPRRALEFLQIENFRPQLIVENRLEQILDQKPGEAGGAETTLRNLVDEFVNAVAAPRPTPAGGSAAALAGALAAALAEMACGVSRKRKSTVAHHAALTSAQTRLAGLRGRLLENIDRDAQSYTALIRAAKLPKSANEEQAVRNQAVEEASKQASTIPLETSELATAVAREVATLVGITITQTASDLRVAASLAEAARRGGIDSVGANLAGVRDEAWRRDIEARLQALDMVRPVQP